MVKYYHNFNTHNAFQKNIFEINTQILKPISNRETIMRVKTDDIKNNGEFFTDSNGLFMIKRKLNYQESYNM